MKKYRQFTANYDRYIVFVENEKTYTRRLYRIDDNNYYFKFNNQKIKVTSEQLYW